MDASEKLLRGIQKLTKDREAMINLMTALVTDKTNIVPSSVFEKKMGINSNTAKTWADAGLIHRFRIRGNCYVNLASLDKTYRDKMRKQNYCFELGKFINTVTDRKALGLQYGFCKETGDFIGIPDAFKKKGGEK